jgi:uncharacterized protein YdaU (DUF1376 family)
LIFYSRHLGDHARRAAHLSLLEEGALSRLDDLYYGKEAPLPVSVTEICRLARASSKAEREAVARVLAEFFELVDGVGWRQERADQEICRFREKVAKATASAMARWNPQQHSDGSANASNLDMRSHTERTANQRTKEPRTKEKDQSGANAPLSAGKLPACPVQALIDVYNEVLPELPRVRLQTKDRTRALQKIWTWVLTSRKDDDTRRAETAEQAIEWFRSYFVRARSNAFLMGRGAPRTGEHASWRCDLDFLLTERGMKHVIEKTAAPDAVRGVAGDHE